MKPLFAKNLKVPGMPVIGAYRVRAARLDDDEAMFYFDLADCSGSVPARISRFDCEYQHPSEFEDAVLMVEGVVTGIPILVDCRSLREVPLGLTGTIQTIPRSCCHPNALDAFDQIVTRVAAIESGVIRRFVESALGSARVYERFFQVAASKRCHHPNDGGLAVHVAEVLHEVECSPLLAGIEPWRRDMAAACAIVHDLPKAIGSGGQSPDRDEAYAALLDSIRCPLRIMEAQWTDGAAMIRAILRGIPRAGDPQYAEAFALWGADRLSSVISAQTHAFKILPDLSTPTAQTAVLEFAGGASRSYTRVPPPPDV